MEEKQMTFWAHLEDLRWSLIRVVAVLLVFVIVCFCAMPYLFDHFVLAPTTSDFPLYRWLSQISGSNNPLLPDFSNGLSIPSLAPIFAKLHFDGVFSLDFLVILFAFLFVDLFDTLGTLVGVSSKAGMLDENGKLPNIKGALLADAVATTAGAVLGTSTTTTFVESASGVSEGGRTGLTAVTTAILFGLSLFLSPIFLAIPSFATAPALVIVGLYMLSNVISIDFSDMSEAIPCYVCIIAMPFFYSISEGISMGIITYVAINLITGKAKEKKISALMYVLAVLFILKYIFL